MKHICTYIQQYRDDLDREAIDTIICDIDIVLALLKN